MRKHWSILVFLVLFSWPQAHAQGSPLDWECLALPTIAEDITVTPYAQVGLQWIGSNMTLPVQSSVAIFGPLSLNIEDFDAVLKDASFWSGTIGATALIKKKYSVFASAGGLLDRPFVTSGEFPVSLGPLGAATFLSFSSTKVESWFVQAGAGLGPIIGGVYWDHFAFSMSDPRNQAGPLANQTIRGDVITKSICPFVGVSLPSGGATATVIYSPLAYSGSTLVLRNSNNRFTEIEYSWNKPGQFVSAMFQYNKALTSSISSGLWANYLWMNIRGAADLTYRSSALAAPIVREVTVSMGKYAYGGGLTLGISF